MPLDQELIDLMLDEVILEPRTAIDKFNNFSYAAALSDGIASTGHVRCQIVNTNKRALDIQGREAISTVQIILADPTLPISTDARLTLPDGTKPAIIELLSAKDDVGPYYLEIRA